MTKLKSFKKTRPYLIASIIILLVFMLFLSISTTVSAEKPETTPITTLHKNLTKTLLSIQTDALTLLKNLKALPTEPESLVPPRYFFILVLLIILIPPIVYIRLRKRISPLSENNGSSTPIQLPMTHRGIPELQEEPQSPSKEVPEMKTATMHPPLVLKPEIFRAYDIRGIVNESLTPEVVSRIGQTLGNLAAKEGIKEFAIARDGRLSGPCLLNALESGLLASGQNVLNLNDVPTPYLYFGAKTQANNSGVMLTGSHNPPDYNGLKMVVGGKTLSGDDIQALYKAALKEPEPQPRGQLTTANIESNYLKAVLDNIQLQGRTLKVVVDCGNGISGRVAPHLLEELGCEVIPLYTEVDGSFPNHHPDPSNPENLSVLINTVLSEKADCGLAFDGDGDRLGVVTNTGEIIWPDRLIMLFSESILKHNPNALILYDVKCTMALKPFIQEKGGIPVMWKTGHSLIKAKMQETQAAFAGEMSGHFFFNDRWYGFDDGIYAACRLLEILSQSEHDLATLAKALPNRFSTPEIQIPVPESQKLSIIDQLLFKAEFKNAKIITLDGLRVEFSNGFGLIRASNTTPNLILRFEGESESALESIKAEFKSLLSQLEESLPLNF